jgi:hypothetical protein
MELTDVASTFDHICETVLYMICCGSDIGLDQHDLGLLTDAVLCNLHHEVKTFLSRQLL